MNRPWWASGGPAIELVCGMGIPSCANASSAWQAQQKWDSF
ncbi:MAG: hypothetical protein ABSD12_13175 [Paraburkholderia sp.]